MNEVIVLLLKEKNEEEFEIILKHNKKEYKDQNKNKDEANNIQMLNQLTKDSYTNLPLENIFCVFESIDNIIYLIYSNKDKSIISFNLVNNQKINEIKKAHNFEITNLRYYLDKKNNRNIIMSISSSDFNLKLWNIKNYECILNIKTINVKGHLLLGCFLNENSNVYIITYNSMTPYNELIRVFDLNGNKIKDIKNYFSFCIDTYYDKKLFKNYIITSNLSFVTSYDYTTGEIYHKYLSNDRSEHFSFIINDKEEIIKLIESSYDGNIRIWNFNTGELIKKIYICKNSLYSICIWDNDTLFVSSYDKKLRLIIKKIKHLLYGKSLISQGFGNEQIKMWIVNN
jgi:WD40 repeat protein